MTALDTLVREARADLARNGAHHRSEKDDPRVKDGPKVTDGPVRRRTVC